jgi:hypothetical protein
MLTSVRTKVTKTKQFVQKHQTAVACVATAAVTYKFAQDVTLNGAIKGVTGVAYEWGAENGVLTVERNILLDFVKEKELSDLLREHIASLT